MPQTTLKKRVIRFFAAALACVLATYVYSRIVSSTRRVAVVEIEQATDESVEQKTFPATFRIATYNIAHGRGLATSNGDGGNQEERQERLKNIAQLLRKMDADVVVLNEVDFNSSWSFGVNQARYLAEEAGYNYYVEHRNFDFRIALWTWNFGNAVLSRYPITSARDIDFPEYSILETVLAGKKRGLRCQLQAGEQLLDLVGVHLEFRSEEVRVRSTCLSKL